MVTPSTLPRNENEERRSILHRNVTNSQSDLIQIKKYQLRG